MKISALEGARPKFLLASLHTIVLKKMNFFINPRSLHKFQVADGKQAVKDLFDAVFETETKSLCFEYNFNQQQIVAFDSSAQLYKSWTLLNQFGSQLFNTPMASVAPFVFCAGESSMCL